MLNSSVYADIIGKFKQDFVYSLHILAGFLDESEIIDIFDKALKSESSK